MKPPAYIQDIYQNFLDGLRAALGNKLYGVYLYGAVAFPETTHTGDIDFHVILMGPLGEQEHSDLKRLHKKLAQDFPLLGGEMDGHYLLLEDAGGQHNRGVSSRLLISMMPGRCIVSTSAPGVVSFCTDLIQVKSISPPPGRISR